MADTCYEKWKNILEKCNEKEQKEIFRWFKEHQNGYVIDYLEDYVSEFLMMAWTIKCQLLESEKLYERLLQEIINMGSIYILDQYEKVLKKENPEKTRDIYADFIRRQADSVTDRKHYKDLMKYLKKIVKYPDGKNTAQRIADEWREIYRRRPAMMDELKKTGL